MGCIRNLNEFNKERQQLLKVQALSDKTLLFTKDEAKEALLDYLKELDIVVEITNHTNSKISGLNAHLQKKVELALTELEKKMFSHIDDKIDSMVEKLFEKIVGRVVEEEVNKRLETKLKNIEKFL